MVHEPIDSGHCRHFVFENFVPLRERQVAGDDDGAALIPFSEQNEQNVGLFRSSCRVCWLIDFLRLVSTAAAGRNLSSWARRHVWLEFASPICKDSECAHCEEQRRH